MIGMNPVNIVSTLVYGDPRGFGQAVSGTSGVTDATGSKAPDRTSLHQAGQSETSPAPPERASEKKNNRPATSAEPEYQRQILLKLQTRDREVRAHEQAHLAAAGAYARSGASFSYQRGPDGKLYAVGGEVAIDISKEQTPEATISKMQTVRRAALAPQNPSAADRQIAARATVLQTQAERELQVERTREQSTAAAETGLTSTSPEVDATTSAAIEKNRNLRSIKAYQHTMLLIER